MTIQSSWKLYAAKEQGSKTRHAQLMSAELTKKISRFQYPPGFDSYVLN